MCAVTFLWLHFALLDRNTGVSFSRVSRALDRRVEGHAIDTALKQVLYEKYAFH